MPLTERPACACHSEPQRWNTDSRYRGGGYWRCDINALAAKRERYDPDLRAERWHRPEGGYVQRRRKQLAVKRARILEQLTQLEQEAVTDAES